MEDNDAMIWKQSGFVGVLLFLGSGSNRQLFTSLRMKGHSQTFIDQLASGTYRMEIESLQ
jgi:hypothetical protein